MGPGIEYCSKYWLPSPASGTNSEVSHRIFGGISLSKVDSNADNSSNSKNKIVWSSFLSYVFFKNLVAAFSMRSYKNNHFWYKSSSNYGSNLSQIGQFRTKNKTILGRIWRWHFWHPCECSKTKIIAHSYIASENLLIRLGKGNLPCLRSNEMVKNKFLTV